MLTTEKNKENLRIVFMGSPDFAVASLKALLEAGFMVVAVVTAADKPAGRGMKLKETAVKAFAVEHDIPVLQPLKLKDSAFVEELRRYEADLQIVVAFRMLPELVWNMPPLGTINVHASLLPNYRGAAPINWAIMNGEAETGVTTFALQHEIDTGNILMQSKVHITTDDNVGTLYEKLKMEGALLLVTTLEKLIESGIEPQPQLENSGGDLKHAPKIFAEHCKINFASTCQSVHNLIRGLSPIPGAFTYLDGKMLKIYKSEVQSFGNGKPTAAYETDGKTFLKFTCADGYLLAEEVQLEGKKRLFISEFLRGYTFSETTKP